MRTRIKIYSWAGTAVGLLLLLSSTTLGQRDRDKTNPLLEEDSQQTGTVSVEEKLIRFAYRKLEVFSQASNHYEGLSFKESAEGGKAIKFNLTNFRIGKIDQIGNRLYQDVVDLPTQEIVQLVPQVIQTNDDEGKIAYRAYWKAGQYARAFDRNWTIRELLKMETAKYFDVTRYAAYDVTVSLNNKTRSYSALVLLHGSRDNFRLEFWDTVVGMGGTLTGVFEEQRVPFGLKSNGVGGSIAREDFVRKLQSYLRSKDSEKPLIDQPLNCASGPEGVAGACCIDQDLAAFWEVDRCGGFLERAVSPEKETEASLLPPDIQFYSQDDSGHISGTGSHHGRARFRPSCTELPNNRQRCYVEIRDQGYGDTESNHSDIYYHQGTSAETIRGNDGPRGQNVDCESAIGFAFDYCVLSSCNVTMSLSVTGHGAGATATVTGGTLWRTARAQGNICNLPSTTTSGSPGGCNQSAEYGCLPGFAPVGGICTRSTTFITQCDRFGGYDSDACGCFGACFDDGSCSPIVVDVLGNGFQMTDASTGAFFDMGGRGTPERFSWTAENSDDAWLALDRNNNGLIDSGRELFGNVTTQDIHPDGVERNGFLALALYDSAAYGGNGDGIISQSDSIFGRLKLWRDDNHNGVSESCELFSLPDLGLEKIDLDYRSSRRVDEYGNQFRYRSKVSGSRDSSIGRWAWDVFLVTQP